MEMKLIEARDAATRMSVMAIRIKPKSDSEKFIVASAGYGGMGIIPTFLIDLERDLTIYRDSWETEENNGSRTLPIVHKELEDNWDKYTSGDVIDVQFILGETEAPKESDRFWKPRGAEE